MAKQRYPGSRPDRINGCCIIAEKCFAVLFSNHTIPYTSTNKENVCPISLPGGYCGNDGECTNAKCHKINENDISGKCCIIFDEEMSCNKAQEYKDTHCCDKDQIWKSPLRKCCPTDCSQTKKCCSNQNCKKHYESTTYECATYEEINLDKSTYDNKNRVQRKFQNWDLKSD